MKSLADKTRLLNELIVKREELGATLLKNPLSRPVENIRRMKDEYERLCRRIARLEERLR